MATLLAASVSATSPMAIELAACAVEAFPTAMALAAFAEPPAAAKEFAPEAYAL